MNLFLFFLRLSDETQSNFLAELNHQVGLKIELLRLFTRYQEVIGNCPYINCFFETVFRACYSIKISLVKVS